MIEQMFPEVNAVYVPTPAFGYRLIPHLDALQRTSKPTTPSGSTVSHASPLLRGEEVSYTGLMFQYAAAETKWHRPGLSINYHILGLRRDSDNFIEEAFYHPLGRVLFPLWIAGTARPAHTF